MKLTVPLPDLPALSAEALADLPDEVRALVGVLEQVVRCYKEAVRELTAHLDEAERNREAQEKQVAELKRRLALDSNNSSKPPSTDPPTARNKNKDKKERQKRKLGAPWGHKGSHRASIPPEAVDHVHDVFPAECDRCQAPLLPSVGRAGQMRRPWKWQQVDIVDGRRVAHQYNLFRLRCSCCGARTRASLPWGVEASAFGPGLKAAVVLLHGRYKLSRRSVSSAMVDLYGVSISPGTIDTICQQASRGLEDPIQGVKKAIQQSSRVHMDETGWRLKAALCYLWTMVTPVAVYFEIGSRKKAVAQDMLGPFSGTLETDRYAAYIDIHKGLRQICWAHLIRDFTASSERSGKAGELGRWALREAAGLFAAWHAFREDDTISRDDLREAVRTIRMRLHRIIQRGVRLKGPDGALYRSLKRHHADALFTFIDEEGVEPTNNAAERALRPAVLWRRASLGSQSQNGCTFVGRILTAIETLKCQGRSTLDYLTSLFTAAARQESGPCLVPP